MCGRLLLLLLASGVLACGRPEPITRDDGPDPGTGGDPGQVLDVQDPGTVPDDAAKDPGFDGTPGDEGTLDGTTPQDAEGDAEAGDPGTGPDDPGSPDAPAIDVPDVPAVAVERPCAVTLTFHPPSPPAKGVGVCGPWNNWGQVAGKGPDDPRACDAMTGPDGAGRFTITWTGGPKATDGSPVLPGEYPYKYCVDGCANGQGWHADDQNPLVMYDAGVENSKLIVPDCSLPTATIQTAQGDAAAGKATWVVQVLSGVGKGPVPWTDLAVTVSGQPASSWGYDPGTQKLTVALEGLPRGKYSLGVQVQGAAAPLFAPLWLEDRPFAWTDAVLYFAFTDRFANGDPTNDAPAPCIPEDQAGKNVNWLGGDWAGLRQKIEEGWFDSLGVNAIWISAANDNPDTCFDGDLTPKFGTKYTAYHGYFPVSLDQAENHFGSLEDLRAMVRAAHARGIRVLMDLAANHVHADAPIYAQHRDWFNQAALLCGADDNWNTHPIDCWFQSYLPDLDYHNNDALNAMTDAAVAWVVAADLDGFRVDAVKHMLHSFGRTLRYKLRQQVETTNIPFYLVGETFVGDWGGGQGTNEATIKAYLGPDELDGQFNFPLYWALISTLGRGEGSLGTLGDITRDSAAYFRDGFAGAIMSNFLGNHDIPRFVSHAAGLISDQWGNGSKELGWTNPPPVVTDAGPYRRLKAAFSFLMTIPGVPLIYYGDEIGLPGAGDPDNRRMMTFTGLNGEQTALKEAVGKLGTFRKSHVATRVGQFVKLAGDKDWLAYAVTAPGDAVVVVLNRGAAGTFEVPVGGAPGVPLNLADLFSGKSVTVNGGRFSIDLGSWDVAVLAL